MKVLILRSNPVKPDSRVEKEVCALKKAGHDVTVFGWDRSATSPNYSEDMEIGGFQVEVIRCGIKSEYGASIVKMVRPLVAFQFKILAYLLKNIRKYDVVHACDFDTAFVSVIVAKLFGKKTVYDIFDYYVDAFNIPDFLKCFIASLDHFAMRRADRILVCTEKRIKQIPQMRKDKIYVVQNSPDIPLSMYSPQGEENGYDVNIAYFGILQEGRLVKELVDIVAKHENWHLDIGGFGLLEKYVEDVAKQASNISYYGKVDYHTVLELERKSDIMTAVYTPEVRNHRFAAPNKFYEAMGLGKPLIVCRDTFVDEYVAKLDCGVIIEYTADDLENAIRDLADRKNAWSTMSDRMRKLYDSELKWEYSEAELLKCYQSLDMSPCRP